MKGYKTRLYQVISNKSTISINTNMEDSIRLAVDGGGALYVWELESTKHNSKHGGRKASRLNYCPYGERAQGIVGRIKRGGKS
jgi:hypothetical protein